MLYSLIHPRSDWTVFKTLPRKGWEESLCTVMQNPRQFIFWTCQRYWFAAVLHQTCIVYSSVFIYNISHYYKASIKDLDSLRLQPPINPRQRRTFFVERVITIDLINLQVILPQARDVSTLNTSEHITQHPVLKQPQSMFSQTKFHTLQSNRYTIRSFTAVFTNHHQWSLSRARWLNLAPSPSPNEVLILLSHLLPCLPSWLFFEFLWQILYVFLSYPSCPDLPCPNNTKWRVLLSGIHRPVKALCLLPLSCLFTAWFNLRPSRCSWNFPPKRRLTSIGLHGVIPQNTELSMAIAVRTSDPTYKLRSCPNTRTPRITFLLST
jgi:hypothetical protein